MSKVQNILLAILIIAAASALVVSQNKTVKNTRNSFAKVATTAGNPAYSVININNLTTWVHSDGASNHTPWGDNGVYFPRGTASVIYQDGFVWGGKAYLDVAHTQPVQLPVRVGGGTYQQGTQAGWISGSGAGASAVSPSDPAVRVYRVRRDYFTASDDELKADAAVYYGYYSPDYVPTSEVQAIRNQYSVDWNEWPVAQGAPYIERNAVPGYQAPPPLSQTFTAESLLTQNFDEPGIAAIPDFPADQVMWTVYNDLDIATSTAFVGSSSLGIEAQVTVWAYKRVDLLGNVIFRRLRLVNKGGADVGGGVRGVVYIDSMYVCQWSDPDVGDFADDLAACDSTLSLAFVYNSGDDRSFRIFNLPPPAVGYDFLQGPLVASNGDSAIFDLKRRQGYKNKGMSSFAYFSAGSVYSDPPRADYSAGTGRWWKMLRGFAPLGTVADADIAYAAPPGLEGTKFPLSGDPVLGTGFLDGLATSYSPAPGDRRILLNTGPFSMAPGDTQEVVTAIMAGLGADRLSSIALLRGIDQFTQLMYDALFALPQAPTFDVQVLYPNASQATVKIVAQDHQRNFSGVAAALQQSDGTNVADVSLLDDGLHEDGSANDGLFGGSITLDRRADALSLSATVTPLGSSPFVVPYVAQHVTTAGEVRSQSPIIFLDNIGSDGVVNPDEYIRYGITVSNNTSFAFSNVRIAPAASYRVDGGITIERITPGSQTVLTYNPNDQNSYFDLLIPLQFSGSSYRVLITITDSLRNRWVDSIEIAISPPQSSQSPWQESPGLNGGNIVGLSIDSTGRLYALNNPYGVYRSTDTGEQWVKMAGNNVPYTYGIAVAPDSSILVIGFRGLYRSTDAGNAWSFTSVDGSYSLCLAGTVIYLGGYSEIRRSTDYGSTWSSSHLSGPGSVRSIAFNSQGYLFAGSTGSGVYRSVDQTNWTNMSMPGTNVQTVKIKSNDHVFAGTDSALFRSTNDGSSWTAMNIGISPFNVSNIYFDSNGDVYARSSTSGIFYSTDNGTSWASAGSSPNKGNVLLRDKSGRLYAYHFGGLYRSTDNGVSWQEKDQGIAGLTVFAFVTLPNSVVLAGTPRGVFRSLDDGQTWMLSTGGLPYGVYGLAKNSVGAAFAAVEHGIFKSTDGGMTWVSTGLSQYQATAITVSPTGKIFAGCRQSRYPASDTTMIFRSDNGGASWNHVWGGWSRVGALLAEAGGYIHAGASGIYSSTDDGTTWGPERLPGVNVYSMATSPSGHLWIGGYYPWRSTDHGVTWNPANGLGLTSFYTRSIAIDWTGNIYVGTYTDAQLAENGSGVYQSTDDGNSWNNLNLGIGMGGRPYVQALGLTDNSYLIVGTNGEGVYRSKGSTVGVEVEPSLEPRIFSLEQNFPNPFNPTTQIRFSLPSETNVKLTIYNLLGQEIARILESKMDAGAHVVIWNGRNRHGGAAASGVYFYRIEAGSYVQTKKMLLIR